MPLFSIIIPTFNSQSTISRALDSVLSQEFQGFEILIMDGVSTDHTISIAKNHEDDRIKIYSEKDKGVYDAMNKGIKKASGDWLYFLGSDDCLHNDLVLQNIYGYLSTYTGQIDVVYGNITSEKYGNKYDGEFDAQKILKKNIGHQSIFYNKKIFQRLGDYDLKYKILADYDFNLRWVLNRQVTSKYIDLIIADYASGGISDNIADHKFYKDFNYNVFKYKYHWMPSIIIKYYYKIKNLAVVYLKK